MLKKYYDLTSSRNMRSYKEFIMDNGTIWYNEIFRVFDNLIYPVDVLSDIWLFFMASGSTILFILVILARKCKKPDDYITKRKYVNDNLLCSPKSIDNIQFVCETPKGAKFSFYYGETAFGYIYIQRINDREVFLEYEINHTLNSTYHINDIEKDIINETKLERVPMNIDDIIKHKGILSLANVHHEVHRDGFEDGMIQHISSPFRKYTQGKVSGRLRRKCEFSFICDRRNNQIQMVKFHDKSLNIYHPSNKSLGPIYKDMTETFVHSIFVSHGNYDKMPEFETDMILNILKESKKVPCKIMFGKEKYNGEDYERVSFVTKEGRWLFEDIPLYIMKEMFPNGYPVLVDGYYYLENFLYGTYNFDQDALNDALIERALRKL